jgi:hypothetical protein
MVGKALAPFKKRKSLAIHRAPRIKLLMPAPACFPAVFHVAGRRRFLIKIQYTLSFGLLLT